MSRSDEPGKPAKRSKVPLFIAVGAFVLLVGGGGAAAFLTGALDSLLGGGEEQHAEAAAGETKAEPAAGDPAAAKPAPEEAFVDLPDFIVNLNVGERKSTFLRLHVNLVIADATDVVAVENLKPKVLDACQTFLRELRADDLRGSAGTARLREELLRRINLVLAPVRASDVLFLDMMIQ